MLTIVLGCLDLVCAALLFVAVARNPADGSSLVSGLWAALCIAVAVLADGASATAIWGLSAALVAAAAYIQWHDAETARMNPTIGKENRAMTDLTPDADDTNPEMFTCGNSRCGRAYDPLEGEDEILCSEECRREDADRFASEVDAETHIPSSEFGRHLDVSAQVPMDTDRDADSTVARQFAVQRPDGSAPQVYGDQDWVKCGAALTARDWPPVGGGLCHPVGSTVVERDITLVYGPWRPLGAVPEDSDLAADVDLVHNFLVAGVGDPHGNVLDVEGDVITLKDPGRVLRITVTRS